MRSANHKEKIMANIKVAIFNQSTVLKDSEIEKAVPAFQKQVHEHFAPAWGIDADLVFVSAAPKAPPGAWWLGVFDDSDQAGALGYHDVTDQGLPLGKVFAKTDMQYGSKWTVTLSHELLEMLGDPDINLTVFRQPNAHSGVIVAYETCDPCEADDLGYEIDGVTVSDFVFPSYFQDFRKTGPFDFKEKIKKPFEILPGGYISEFDVTKGTGWHQITAATKPRYDWRARVGSRRERRRTPRDRWLPSNPKR